VKLAHSLPVLIALSLAATMAIAADETTGATTAVDTSSWKCKFCAFEEGASGTIDVGAGYVSDNSFKFGEFNGLNEQGAYFVGGADLRSRAKDGGFWNLTATDLGLDSRELRAEGGRQGKYRLFLDYDELPHFISDSGRTPFLGVGGDSLTLPPGWVRAGSTGGMTALAGTLHDVDLETKRKHVSVGASLIAGPHWEYAVKVQHETKEGTMRTAGAFLFTSTQLVMPVDYVTDQVDVTASYASAKWQARFGYYGSTFKNHDDALTWQNPFTATVAGADAGQLAAPPDNQFHQILAAAGYQFTEHTRGTADIAVGRMTQNENFLAPTLNSSLSVPALPRSSLDGRVDTFNADMRLLSDVSDRLRLTASYTYNDRDNKTPQAAYTWVTTDSFVNAPRTNLPYSFTQNALKLSADYRTAPRVKTSVGVDYDAHKRTFQEVDKTQETSVWGKVVTRAQDNLDLTFKLAHADRNVSSYQAVPQIDPPENPLLRKYNMADRTRDSVGVRADATPAETVTFGFGFDYSTDDYPNSTIGLTKGDDVNVSADASVSVSKTTSLQFYLNHEELTSTQAGSQTFAAADWTARSDNTIDTAGVGVKHAAIKNKLDVGADYSVTRARGEITVTSGASTPFPDLTTYLGTIKLYANYTLKKNLSLHGAYWYEHYRTADWALAGVAPDTIANVLTLGEVPPSYHIGVVTLFMRYKF
jgi:MtrB/PioB family decaheme-associated outer membrane protein